MQIAELIKEIQQYKHNGFIHPYKDRDSGNGWLYTAEYLIALLPEFKIYLELDQPILDEISSIIEATKKHQITSGLLKRTPSNAFGQESIDDYTGAALIHYYLSKIGININLARDIINYGLSSPVDKYLNDIPLSEKILFHILKDKNSVYWVYNNINPGYFTVRAYLGRFVHLIACLQYALREEPPLWRKIWVALSYVYKTPKPEEHDRWILPWIMSKICYNQGCWFIDLAIKYWKKKAKKYFKSPGELLGKYFNDFEHPLSKALMNREF